MPRSKKDKSPSFEQALSELEDMVETMESGQLPLEKLIANYEHGAELIAHCETVLDDARKRLELVTLKPTTTDTPKNSTNDSTVESPSIHANDDDEIRLF